MHGTFTFLTHISLANGRLAANPRGNFVGTMEIGVSPSRRRPEVRPKHKNETLHRGRAKILMCLETAIGVWGA